MNKHTKNVTLFAIRKNSLAETKNSYGKDRLASCGTQLGSDLRDL